MHSNKAPRSCPLGLADLLSLNCHFAELPALRLVGTEPWGPRLAMQGAVSQASDSFGAPLGFDTGRCWGVDGVSSYSEGVDW